MSKKTEQETQLAVQEQQENAISRYDYGDDAGAGFENVNKNHVSLPFISQLQALSPEVAGTADEVVNGARPGKFINSVTQELYDSVKIQPVMVRHTYVEWKPERKGKAGEHLPESREVKQAMATAKAEGRRFNDLKLPNGNLLTETFYLLALQHLDNETVPVMLSFSSTKINAYRVIMTRASQVRIAGKQPPLFAHQWLVTSCDDRNSQGQPFKNIRITAAVDNNILKSLLDPGSYEMAKALAAAYVAGEATPVDEVTGSDNPLPDIPF